MKNQTVAFKDSKAHYALLDGLRGAAALMVVWYHLFEGFAFSAASNGCGDGVIRCFNHGYLAVDFFFILSGFVIGYAYDDRWKNGASAVAKRENCLTTSNFFLRRLVRLHPMLVMGSLLGVLSFCLGGCEQWDGDSVPLSMVVWSLGMALFLIPATPGMGCEVRGNGEMFPLNGPTWSLFFEYLGNILYALVLRRLSDRWLRVLVCVLGAAWAWWIITDVSGYGMIGVGWTLDVRNMAGGSLRMLFPFSMGLLISRHFRPVEVKGVFWICVVLLYALFSVPYLTSDLPLCVNGIYEMVCIAIVFPLMVVMAASGKTTDRISSGVCRFLGEISYPLYLVHYPVMYLFYAWLIRNEVYSLSDCRVLAVSVMAGSCLLAYLCLKCYDIPIRRMLSNRLMGGRKQYTVTTSTAQ